MKSDFAYERLAGEIEDQVRQGVLRAGDRVPSVRQTSRKRGVSVSTVLQAYRTLESRQVIGAYPRSGFYVLDSKPARILEPERTRPGDEPTPVTSGSLIAEVLSGAGDRDLVPLGAALPDPRLLPTGALNRAMGTVLRRDPHRATSLMESRGAIELRREIARREWEAGCAVGAEDIWVTCGGSEALSLALRATTRPGDTVAVESPTFFGVLQAIESLGCRALEIPTDARNGMCIESLTRALDRSSVSACVVTPNFQNPLGALMPDEAKRALVSLAAEREMPLIEDDTFGELYFEGPRPRSLLADDANDWVIRCSSFSKTLAPGYRIGWIVPGRRFRDAVQREKYSSSVATAAPPQLAIAQYLGGRRFDDHLRRLRRVLRFNVDRLVHAVCERFPDGTRVSRPAGGFLVWIELHNGVDAVDLHRAARTAGVGVSPGVIYSPTCGYRDCLRLSAGFRWGDDIDRGVELLARLAREMAPT